MQRLDVEVGENGRDDTATPSSLLEKFVRCGQSLLPRNWQRDRGGFTRLEQDDTQGADGPSRPTGLCSLSMRPDLSCIH